MTLLPSIFSFQKSNSKIPKLLRLILSTWENHSIRSRPYRCLFYVQIPRSWKTSYLSYPLRTVPIFQSSSSHFHFSALGLSGLGPAARVWNWIHAFFGFFARSPIFSCGDVRIEDEDVLGGAEAGNARLWNANLDSNSYCWPFSCAGCVTSLHSRAGSEWKDFLMLIRLT